MKGHTTPEYVQVIIEEQPQENNNKVAFATYEV